MKENLLLLVLKAEKKEASKEITQKMKQMRLKAKTLQRALEKIPILLVQYLFEKRTI